MATRQPSGPSSISSRSSRRRRALATPLGFDTEELCLAAVDRALATVLSLSVADFTEVTEKLSPVQRRLLRSLAKKPARDLFSKRFVDITGPAQWVEALGLIAMFAVALTWLGVAFGLFSKSAAGANSLSLIPQLISFVSSAFVPTSSMPAGVRWFAENQPFTPLIETLRALLMGMPIGGRGAVAAGWCVVIAVAGCLWARHLYNRDPSRRAGPGVAQLMSQ